MPGSSHCARCAASLTLQSDEIDVNPPRASALAKRIPVRAVAAARRGTASTRSAIASVLGVARPAASFHGGTLEILSLAVPGLHQYRSGEKSRAAVLIGGYIALLIANLILAGTGPGSMLMGLLFAWHLISAVDAIARDFVTPGDRLRLTGVTAAGLLICLYLPALWLFGQVATPINVAMTSRHVQAGDVLWYNPSTDPQPGDLVLYDVPATRFTARTGAYGNTVYQVQGDRINRVIAVGGQRVKIDPDGTVFVDGEVSPWQPAANTALPRGKEISVRPGIVMILPEDLLPAMVLTPETAIRLALCPNTSVRGTIIARTFPPSRFQFY